MKFLLNFQAQKTIQERIIVERFSSSAPSTTTFAPKTLHAVINVIHKKVYDIIQIEVSRKKLESSTSVAAVHRRPKLSEERDKVFYRFGGAAPGESSNQAAETIIDTRIVHFNDLKNQGFINVFFFLFLDKNEKKKTLMNPSLIICLVINRHYKLRYR